jgi:hypothetical protein
MINDKELLAMIRDPKTQREGFAVLVSQYSEPLYWKVRHIVLDHDDADRSLLPDRGRRIRRPPWAEAGHLRD